MRHLYLAPFIVILFIFVSPSWPQKGRRQVSVISFENQSKDQKKYEFLKEQLPSLIEARLQKEKQIRLQTRRNLKFIFEEIELTQSGFLDKTKTVDLQRMVQSDHLVVGSYEASSDSIKVKFQLIEVKSGKIGFVSNLDADGYADLLWDIERASGMMAAEILGQRLAFLSVNSTPDYARAYLNGNFIGRTPVVRYPLSTGKHELILHKTDYLSKQMELEVQKEEHHAENVELYFKGYELYKNQVLVSTMLSLPSFGNGVVLKDNFDTFRASLGLQRYFHHFLVGASLSMFTNQHVNEVNVFGSSSNEIRRLTHTHISIHAKYHYLLHPAWIGVFGGFSLGWRYIEDDDITSGRTDSFYLKRNDLFQPGVHLGIDLLPASQVGLTFELSYLPSFSRVHSFAGTFNPLGEKRFREVGLAFQQVIFSFGVRASFEGDIDF